MVCQTLPLHMAVDTETTESSETTTQDDLRFALASVVGGTVGTTIMIGVFWLTNFLSGPSIRTFSAVAELAGVGPGFLRGFLLFFGAGAVAWPLVFATLGPYLPGRTRIRQGVVFAMALWLGFATAFGGQYLGEGFAIFVGFSLFAHLVYGAVLGGVAGRVSGRRVAPELDV